MPPITPELVALRSGAQALVRVLGRKKATAFLREWIELLETEDAILPIRPPSERGQVILARRQTLAWLRAVLPSLMASMPSE